MTLRFTDGFDHYITDAAGADVLKKWTGGISGTTYGQGQNVRVMADYAYGGHGMGLGFIVSDANRRLYKTLSVSPVTLIMGAWVRFAGAVPNNVVFMNFLDGTTEQLSLRGDNAGHLRVSRNGTTLGDSTLTVAADTWYFIEFKATINDTTGVAEVKVNGTTYITLSGVDTKNTANAFVTGVGIGSATAAGVWFDHLYVVDTAGSVNNDFLGAVIIASDFAESAGTYTQWDPNGYTNFAGVADSPAIDGDVSFNSTATAGDKDTFRFSKLPVSAGTILAVNQITTVRQDAGAQRTFRQIRRIDGTDYNGSTINLTGTYAMQSEIMETSPDSGVAWTIAELNDDSEFGYELVS